LRLLRFCKNVYGKTEVGNYDNGKKNGIWKITLPDGKVKEENWQYGKLKGGFLGGLFGKK